MCRVCKQHVLGGVPGKIVGDGFSGCRASFWRRLDNDDDNNVRRFTAGEQRAREATNERVHGLVTWPASANGARQPQDAQLGDLQAPRRRLEASGRRREAAVHRRGEAPARAAHGRAPRLQVPAATPAQVDPDGRREAVGGHGQDGDGVQRPRQAWRAVWTHRRLASAIVAVVRPTTVRSATAENHYVQY